MTDWVPESRVVPVELTLEYSHPDFVPTVVQRMEGYSIMQKLAVMGKELWLAMAKEVR